MSNLWYPTFCRSYVTFEDSFQGQNLKDCQNESKSDQNDLPHKNFNYSAMCGHTIMVLVSKYAERVALYGGKIWCGSADGNIVKFSDKSATGILVAPPTESLKKSDQNEEWRMTPWAKMNQCKWATEGEVPSLMKRLNGINAGCGIKYGYEFIFDNPLLSFM